MIDLLANVIDYAGLFPPAGLDMQAAARNFDAYHRGADGAWLGRFVVPASRLEEFERAAAGLTPAGWRLSALLGLDPAADLAALRAFNERHPAEAMRIDAVELKAADTRDVLSIAGLVPAEFAAYLEIPIAADPTPLIEALADRGLRAKVRTGGLRAEEFPAPTTLARFLVTCANEDVPFKATAGLHHPIRGVHPITYEPDSPRTLMHGFLNVLLAATFAQNGIGLERVTEILEEQDPAAFQFEPGGVFWRGEMAVRAHLRNTRHLFAISFGSCSFDEPIAELKTLGLL